MLGESQNADEGGLSSNSALTFKEGRIFYNFYNDELEYCIFNIIKSSEKYIFLVSPFTDHITHWQKLKNYITDAFDNGKKIFLILNKPNIKSQNEKANEKAKKDLEKIDEIKNILKDKIELFLINFLHSKIYLNEKQTLITSANLESYSLKNNHEIGCLIDDPAVSKWIIDNIIIKKFLKNEEIEHIDGKWAEWINECIINGKIPNNDSGNNDNHPILSNIDENNNLDNLSFESKIDCNESENIKQGHCIRCKKDIPFNFKKPVCDECDASDKDSNDGIYCHKCKTNNAYIAKNHPLCYPCYKNL